MLKRAVLLVTVLLAGCASAWAAELPGHRNGVGHGVAAAGAVWVSDRLTGNSFYGWVAACAGFAAHEWEESRGFSDWSAGGKTDSIMDMWVPCAAGLTLSLHLR